MLQSVSTRSVFIALVTLSVVSMAFAVLFLQRYLGLAPCPLCMTQRVFVVAWGMVAVLAAIHHPRAWGNRVYAGVCALCAVAGGAVAARQVWLQHLPADEVPACGPSLEYLLQAFPFREALELILKGDGSCAEVQWTFLGLSIAEQTLIVFAVAASISLWQTCRSYPRGN